MNSLKTYVWMSDIHLNFLDTAKIVNFCDYLKQEVSEFDGVLISGDISEAPQLFGHLSILQDRLDKPVWYVLGNHDYWKSSFDMVHKGAIEQNVMNSRLICLDHSPVVKLTGDTALIGVSGWYDAQCGSWQQSTFGMMDWYQIHDFIPVQGHKASIVGLSRKRASIAVDYLETRLQEAFDMGFKNVVVVTHFPPFEHCARHNGGPSDADALPWYTSKAMGDMLLEMSLKHTDRKVTVLCGHTHDKFHAVINPWLQVYVAGAEYGFPRFEVIKIT